MESLKNSILYKIEQKRGLSATEAMRMNIADVRTLNRSQLAYMVSTISSAANKRIVRLSKAGQPIEDTVDKFSVAGKNRNELLREWSRVRSFMQNEKMSLSGQRDIRKKVTEELSKKEGFNKAELKDFFSEKETYDNFWNTWSDLRKGDAILKESSAYKYRTLQQLRQMMVSNKDASMDDIKERMKKLIDVTYKDVKQEEEKTTDVFSIDGKV